MRLSMLRNTIARSQAAWLLASALVLAPALAPAQVDDDASDMTSRFVLELQQMREELRELRGLVESQAQEIENLKRRQRDQYLDLDRRIGGLEGAAAMPNPASPSSAMSTGTNPADAVGIDADGPVSDPGAEAAGRVPPPSDLPEVREQLDSDAEVTTLAAPARPDVRELQQPSEAEMQAYDQAFLALRETRYADAAEGFDRFLQDHPRSSLAPNALYWLGEVYYVTRDFETALGQFNDLLERYPGSGKEPDALLKIGFSHYELEHWIEARAALQQVAEQFPGTNYSRLAENRLRTMRLEGRL